jgi:Hsp70 protein
MVLGVDLGAANARAAVATAGLCSVLRLGESSVSTPSAVGRVNGRVLLGDRARARATTDPQRVLLNPIEALLEGKASLDGELFGQDEVVGWWLGAMLQRARQERNEPVRAVAVCAPSYALLDVGLWFESAAFDLAIPRTYSYCATTAAAVGVVATTRAKKGILAVVDVGARQIEAALFELDQGSPRVLSRARRRNTGAQALDRKVAEAFVCDVASLETFQGLNDSVLQLLCQHCESIRCDLSQVTEARLSVPFLGPMLGQPDLGDWVLDRFRLESLARQVADGVLAVCKESLVLAELSAERVDLVAAVGGLSRMPLVRRELQVAFDKTPLRQVDPDGAAVSGAALLGASEEGMVSFRIDESSVCEALESSPADSLSSLARVTPSDREAVVPPAPADSARQALPPGRASAPHFSVGSMMAANPPVVSDFPEEPKRTRESSVPSEANITVSSAPESEPVPGGARPSIGAILRSCSRASSAPDGSSRPPSADSAPPKESSRPSRAPAVDIPRIGGFCNALTPEEMLALPFTRKMTPEDVSPPALPILLMHYGRCKDLNAVVTVSSGDKGVSIPIVGAQFAPPTLREREEFLEAFGWTEGNYRIETEGVPPDAGRYKTESLAKIAIDGLRGVLADLPDELVRASMGDMSRLAPKVSKRGLAMAEALGFWSTEERFLKYRCDGMLVGNEAVHAGGLSEATALRVLFIMLLLGQVRWLEPERPVEVPLAQRVEAEAKRVVAGNAFDALGLHWSAPESEVQEAHDRLVEQYGPSSEAASAAPKAAAKIVDKAREVLPILMDPNKRLALLRRTHPDLDFQSIADLLHKRAVALSLKGQDGAAKEAKRVQREVAPLMRRSGYDRNILRAPSKPPEPKPD